MTAPQQCKQCKGARYLLDRTGELTTARVCECNRACAACGGAGRIYETDANGYTFAKPCRCGSISTRVVRFNAARLPARCGLSFDEFQPQNEEQAKAQAVARTTAMKYARAAPSKGFLLAGPVGSGKTHLLCATLRHVTLELGVSARYVEISFLFAEIRHGFSQNRSGLEAIQPLVDVDVLAIDELGKGKGSPFELDTLDELIARRYNANRTTLLATNYSLADRPTRSVGSPASESHTSYGNAAPNVEPLLLRERVGERIWSRLNEMCYPVQLPAATPDFRRRVY